MARKITPPVAKPYHHGDLRRALIDAGLRVLAEKGTHALNLREVARVAEVSHTAPYRHFADKDGLIAAIAEDGFRQLSVVIDAANACVSDRVADKLITAGQAYVRFAIEHPDHFKVMFSGVRNLETHPELYAASKQGFHFLIATIQDGQQRQQLIAGDPMDLAKTIWAMMHGLAILLIEKQFPTLQGTVNAQQKQALQIAQQCIQVLMTGMVLEKKTGATR